MRRTAVLALTLLSGALVPVGSARAAIACPAGAVSANVECIANLPEMRTAIAVNFIGDVMFVSTTTGLFAYSFPASGVPTLLGALPMYIWENEDMDVDPVRKRVFISRDPRGFTTQAPGGTFFPYGGVHIIDVSDPRVLRQIGFFLVPAGHTSTCVNDCDFLWTGGPYANPQTQSQWTGRPIFATDVRDPANPVACPQPIDLGRNDGVTDYAHDVQVDANGVAWVSGAGGVRGYWTEGTHWNPLTDRIEVATACAPIPYAGGGTPNTATPSRFMHNAWRNIDANIPDEDDPETEHDETLGAVLYATEENITSNCASSGRFATYDIRTSLNGEGWKDIQTTKFRMRALDTWTPQGQAGSTGCASAHYLDDRGDGVVAYAFYGQGTRFLDVSDPKDIRQIGHYRPDGASTWAPYWYRGFVVIADNARGIDVIRFSGDAADPVVPEPPAPRVAVADSPMDEDLGYLCPIPGAGLTIA